MKYFPKLIILLLFAFSLVAIFSTSAKALSNIYPADEDSSGGANVLAVNGETTYVRKQNSNLRVWFTSDSGDITIKNGNFCPGNPADYIESAGYYRNNPIPDRRDITTFTAVKDGNQTQKTGQYYAGGGPACMNDITFSFNNIQQRENGYYFVNLNVDYNDRPGGFDGIMNYYKIVASGPNSIVGLRTPPKPAGGFDATQEQVDTSPQYTTYFARFGSPCNLTGPEDAEIALYDLDNAGGDGAQPVGKDITVKLYDLTAPGYVDFNGGIGKTWKPASVNNDRQARSFTARPDHKYRLEVENVFWNNTIQYSLPYSQIFYQPCRSATIDPKATVTDNSILVGQSTTFYNWTETRNTANTGADTFDWVITGVGPNTSNNNVSINPDRDIPGDKGPWVFTATAADAGKQFCRTTDVSGKPFYANYAAGQKTATACVNVGVAGSTNNFSTTTTGLDFEKGSLGGANVTGTVVCRNNSSGTVNWSISSPGAPGVPPYTSGPLVANFGAGCSPGGTVSRTITVPPGPMNIANVGPFITYTSTISSPSVATPSSNFTVNVYEVPYARFYGNDVYSASTILFNDNINPLKETAGSAVEYAAIAASVAQLDTAIFRGPPPVAPNGLKTTWPSGTEPSIVSIFNNLPSKLAIDPSADWTKDGLYNLGNGPVTLSSTNVSKKVTIRAKNIVIGSGGITTAALTVPFDSKTAPYVLLIADENIFIDKDVTRIDAVLVAGKNIYTCAIGTSEVAPRANWHNDCRKKLTVNGAMAAENIRFSRSIGSRLLGDVGETANRPAGADSAAEVVNFPAYLYFTYPYLGSGGSANAYQSIFNLPPYL